jgi:hypothetical protein
MAARYGPIASVDLGIDPINGSRSQSNGVILSNGVLSCSGPVTSIALFGSPSQAKAMILRRGTICRNRN